MSHSGLLAASVQIRQRTILRNVYMWMTAGLAMTAAVAWWTSNTPEILQMLFGNGPLPFYALVIGEFVLVIVLSRKIMTMRVSHAVGGFILYSVLNGLTLSVIFLAYTGTAIFQAFVSSSSMFAVMSLWAVSTKRDLSGWEHYLLMGIIGLVIAGLVGIYIGGETYQLLYSAAGVVLFTLLTAYDTQKIQQMSSRLGRDIADAQYTRISILGALKLYLDFINMFLFLLRIFGRRR